MTQKTERTNVIQIALTTTLRYRQDVIGIPEAAPAGDGLHPVQAKTCGTSRPTRTFESSIRSNGIDLAHRTSPTIARKDLIAKIPRVSAETPLVDAVVAAKRSAAFGKNLKIAPAAQRQPIRAFWQRVATGTATGESAWNEHRSSA